MRKNIARKMVAVMADLKRIAKNGRNDFHKYDFVTESDVMDAVRGALEKQGLCMFTSVEGSQKDGNITSVITLHTLIDSESGEEFSFRGFGQGADNSDKGGPKAITSATKYALLKTFLLSSGDDPEASDENGKSTGGVKRAVAAAPASAPAAGKATYGFSNRAKTTAKVAAVAEPEVDNDSF